MAFIPDFEKVTIFSNIFNNAIEACSEADKKNIMITIKKYNNSVLISVKNSFNKETKIDLNNLKTTKQNHTGIGLQNVQSTVSHLLGDTFININEDMFCITIFLPLNRGDQ